MIAREYGTKFGDVLKYREPGVHWRFMFICTCNDEANYVQVLYVPPVDDLWHVGDIIVAGKKELILEDER